MAISSLSSLNSQSVINMKKNRSQLPNNQIAFRGITKNTLVRTQNNYQTIGLVLSSLGAALMSALGIKSVKEASLNTSFKEIANKRNQAIDIEY